MRVQVVLVVVNLGDAASAETLSRASATAGTTAAVVPLTMSVTVTLSTTSLTTPRSSTGCVHETSSPSSRSVCSTQPANGAGPV